ncbi:MAG: alkaline phosphatase D family protein [Candidatus Rokuibacteriota bacterium]
MALIWAALSIGAAAAVAAAGVAVDRDHGRLLVTVGEVSDRGAVVWARPPGAGPVTVDLGGAAAGSPARRRLSAAASRTRDFTVKLPVRGLASATRHTYRVTWRGESVEGGFDTAPEPGTRAGVRLLWSGDLGGAGRCRRAPEGYAIFRAMAARRPQAFVFVGDTVYADHRCRVPENVPGADFVATSVRGFRAKHRYQRADRAVQAFFRQTAVYAIWDDHEVRNDFAGPVEPLMPAGRRAFLDYWPIVPPRTDPGRLYRRVRWGGLLELFILDTRQYRSANALPDGPEKTMLGAAQREWLLASVTGSDAVWKVIVSSVTLSVPTGRTARDGWANGRAPYNRQGTGTGFERELLEIVRRLAEKRVRNLVWLAADVHRAEVIRHAPRPDLTFHELVAGPLSASTGTPGALDETLRPTRLFAGGGYPNFGELDVGESALTVRIVDGDGTVRHEAVLTAAP